MTKHVMVDLETLGTNSNAPILSIGAVRFDPDPRLVGERMLDKFHVAIDMSSIIGAGSKFVVDGKTLDWWFNDEQNAARQNLNAYEKLPIGLALDGFAQWFFDLENDPVPDPKASRPLWGNGAAFDNVVLRNAYMVCGLPVPWKYSDDRCFRTIKNLGPYVGMPEPIGITHNALDDAIFQTQWLLNMQDYMKVELD